MTLQNYTEEEYPVIFIELTTQSDDASKCSQINVIVGAKYKKEIFRVIQ